MTLRAQALALAAALLLTGCTTPITGSQPTQSSAPTVSAVAASTSEPQAAALGSTWTGQAGDLQIDISAPASVPLGEFYPLEVTYTNTGTEPLELGDPFHCSVLGAEVVDTATQRTPQVERDYEYGCTSNVSPPIQLKPQEGYSGTAKAIISGFPAGQYRLSAGWLGAEMAYGAVGDDWEMHQKYPLTPAAPEVRFEIH